MSTDGPRFTTKTEWVYERLRGMIVQGELQSGERLRMTPLAHRLRTSEMPVREALRMLQRDGLVSMESHRGATVATVGWDRVYESVMIRMHLEVLAAGEATPYHTSETVAELEELVDRMERLAERGRAAAYSDANRTLHTLIYDPAPYPMLKQEIQDLWDSMWRSRSRSLFRLAPDRLPRAQQEHAALVVAVARGDAAAAGEAARRHMTRTLDAWRRIVDANREPSDTAKTE